MRLRNARKDNAAERVHRSATKQAARAAAGWAAATRPACNHTNILKKKMIKQEKLTIHLLAFSGSRELSCAWDRVFLPLHTARYTAVTAATAGVW
jgi:hypothetical protein